MNVLILTCLLFCSFDLGYSQIGRMISSLLEKNCFTKEILQVYSRHFKGKILKITTLRSSKDERSAPGFRFPNFVNAQIVIVRKIVKLDITNQSHNEDIGYGLAMRPNPYKLHDIVAKYKKSHVRAESYDDPYNINVFIVNKPDVLDAYLKTHNNRVQSRTPRVVLITSSNIKEEHLTYSLKRNFETFQSLNTILHAPCSPTFGQEIFLYQPFEKNQNGIYGRVEAFSVKTVLAHPDLLVNDPTNFNGFPIKVSIFNRRPTAFNKLPPKMQGIKKYDLVKNSSKFYGVDGVIVAEMSRILNFSIVVNDNNSWFGWIQDNGTAIGSLHLVTNREVDFQANGRFFKIYSKRFFRQPFEFGRWYFFDEICLIAPKSRKVPKWMQSFVALVGDKIFVVTFSLTVGIAFIVNWIIIKLKGLNRPSYSLDLVAIFLNQSSKCIKENNIHRRILVTGFMLFVVTMSTVFTTQIFQTYSQTKYFPDLNTLQDVEKSGFPIRSSTNPFENRKSALFEKLSKRIYDEPFLKTKAHKQVNISRNLLCVERFTDAKVLLKFKYLGWNGKPSLHIVKECPTAFFFSHVYPRGSPFILLFDTKLSWFVEHGFIAKWYEDFADAFENATIRVIDDSAAHAFNMTDVQAAFFCLTVGHLVATLAFIGELLYLKIFIKKISFNL